MWQTATGLLIPLCISNVVGQARPTGSTCEEIMYKDPTAEDGEYTLSCNEHSFRAYCHGMQTGDPKEFISLPVAATSRYVQDAGPPQQQCMTTYTKIRINPCTLQVDSLDRTFATSTGSYTWNGVAFSWLPLAHAGNCISRCDTKGLLDLSGTTFAINSTFEASGCCPACGTAEIGPNEQEVKLTGGGYCGFMRVKDFDDYSYEKSRWLLRLKLVAGAPTPPPPPHCSTVAGSWIDSCSGDPVLIQQDQCLLTMTDQNAGWSPASGFIKQNFITATSGFEMTGTRDVDPRGLVKISWANGCIWSTAQRVNASWH